MTYNDLEVTAEKVEALVLKDFSNTTKMELKLKDIENKPQESVKYLRIKRESIGRFTEDISKVKDKARND